jgi:hypothetical protein
VLIEQDGDQLRLWDTPGFGDTARLMQRLRDVDEPLVWFLKQQWDRVTDRPFWCSQQGIINIKEEADVVLYLAGAAEDPDDAGFIPLELDLLDWIGRPVLFILNQIGARSAEIESRWRGFVERWPIVKEVLPLYAFARSWTEEAYVLERVAPLLDGDRRRAMERLTTAWNERNLAVFGASCRHLAAYVTQAALDLELAESTAGPAPTERGAVRQLGDALKFAAIDKRRAMQALGYRLDAATQQLMEALIIEHGLAGSSAARIEEHLREYKVKGRLPINERSGAVAGAVLSGALGGLIADVSIGFLSFGGGMVAGGILGALGGSALARGYRLVGGTEEPSVRWSAQFLDRLVREAVLRYLAVAHFGRGRGDYRDTGGQADWDTAVADALQRQQSRLKKLWTLAERSGSAGEERIRTELERVVDGVARSVLRQAYPRARKLLGGG